MVPDYLSQWVVGVRYQEHSVALLKIYILYTLHQQIGQATPPPKPKIINFCRGEQVQFLRLIEQGKKYYMQIFVVF